MTVGELMSVIGRYEFLEVEGDNYGESPSYSGRKYGFHEDLNYEIICEMPVVGIFLAEDEERNAYGLQIYYDDRGLEDAIQRYENDNNYS